MTSSPPLIAQRTVMCTNPNCTEHKMDKHIYGRSYGDHLVEWPSILCICGWEPKIIGQWTNGKVQI